MTSKTKKALTGLEWAIAQTIQEPKQADEFTAQDFALASKLPASRVKHLLPSMVNRGELTKRKMLVAGKVVNVFKKAE
jgi:hypothetical protein